MRSRWLLASGVAALTLHPTAHALQMKLTRSDLCKVSDLVVVGTVAHQDTAWAATPEGGLERRTLVSASHTLRGAKVSQAEVLLPGGELNGFRHWVEDVPDLEIGATYLLFLGRTAEGWNVLGGDQGAVRVVTPGTVGFGDGEPLSAVLASVEGCHAR